MDKPLTDDELDTLERWAKGSRGSRVSPLLLRLISEVRGLKKAIDTAMGAIETLPEDALGRHPKYGHPYRDELLSNLGRALTGEDQ